MARTIKAVSPYIYTGQLNFKNKPFEVWRKLFGNDAVVEVCYPRWLHNLWFKCDLIPTLWQSKTEARLVFVQPVSLYFDAGFSVLTHEVIPMIWDCWEQYDNKVVKWMKRHHVKRAIFTSEISANRIKTLLPSLEALVITEGIDADNYPAGKELKDRTLDMFNFGRMPLWAPKSERCSDLDFASCLQNAKVSICVPRCDVDSTCHETLTQRYWEVMLSRMVMLGRAPKELVDLIGYNPVIKLDKEHVTEQVQEIISHIEEYQELVDKNRKMALELGDWRRRIKDIQNYLSKHGYCI